nr:cupin domain-containing protein [Paraburkholderia susongensis]
MTSEPLSDMLRLLGVQSDLTGTLIAGGAWSIGYPKPDRIKFWGIVKGRCWVRMDNDGTIIELKAGDVLVILRPAPMTLATDFSIASTGVGEVLSRAQRRLQDWGRRRFHVDRRHGYAGSARPVTPLRRIAIDDPR